MTIALLLAACGPSETVGVADSAAGISDAPAADGPNDGAALADAVAPDAPIDATPCVPAPDGEVCNGVDDDCDGTADEGFPGVGAECDVGVGACERTGTTVCTPDGAGVACSATPGDPETELCETFLDEDCDGLVDEGFGLLDSPCTVGVGACENTGAWICSADLTTLSCSVVAELPGTELCGTSIDEDCDGLVDEGFPALGTPCSIGAGACAADGTNVCNAAGTATVCSATPGPSGAETCNGVDDDCDGTIDDGNPGGGSSCATGLAGVCSAGTVTCSGGALSCQQNTTSSSETCNGLDDDCDMTTDEGYSVGTACDGTDGDACAEGVIVCNGAGAAQCNDTTGTNGETCDGADNDCDGSTDEGYTLGAACDGADTDLCNEGTTVCNAAGTGTTCNDATTSTTDVCDGVDNDCTATTADGAADPLHGTVCDGSDSDLCNEGTWSCVSGSMACGDTTGNTLDLCDGSNNDCDATSADGSEDPMVGAACDGADADVCVEGTSSCTAGALSCSDATGDTPELCNGLDDDCDGTVDDGWNRNDNPVCTGGTFYLGTVSGDTGSGTLSDSWYDEEWDEFELREDSSSSIYVSATVSLTSPPGTDYDLYVYCVSCGGTLAGSSTLGGTTGHTDTVLVRTDDDAGPSDTIRVIVEVRHWSSTVCANWTLNVTGNTAVTTESCP